ncbi:HipA family kinase [Umezawaea beigongshangensis]|uniref:HipA family kinase n=1 Tax=Umezawaea beigongshangensis TaxID=2780383 RepID=UPI0027DD0D1C|nr:HipA family kinase [Umezawaea beigongshangensis]
MDIPTPASALREVEATRYVTPFREGGSLPGLVEADDLGMYVLKFRGAGQGVKALVAEVVVGELARRLDFRVPEIVLADLDPELARAEPDQEVQELLRASGGRNLGIDYLPGSFDYNPVVREPGTDLATRLLWLDALVLNVDRSWRNPNTLLWHRQVWLIDHGAALYFHHRWGAGWTPAASYRWDASDHLMLPFAGPLGEVDREMSARVTPGLVREVLALVPDEWLAADENFSSAAEVRDAYAAFFAARLAGSREWVDALEAARAARV